MDFSMLKLSDKHVLDIDGLSEACLFLFFCKTDISVRLIFSK